MSWQDPDPPCWCGQKGREPHKTHCPYDPRVKTLPKWAQKHVDRFAARQRRNT